MSQPEPPPPAGVFRCAPDQKFCYACGVPIHISAASCPSCGAAQSGGAPVPEFTSGPRLRLGEAPRPHGALIAGQVFCRGCGAPIHDRAPLCPHCGAPQAALRSLPEGQKSKLVAALLAFFLGGIGMHKFYLGEVGLGIVYLLFCWTFIPGLIALIEGIVYLASSDDAFARRYG